ncbi:MAG TPA: RNA methyltransferase [Burkholderiales bacterium]|nr:RNA methyltransferase [Burkholderiales bacterium]
MKTDSPLAHIRIVLSHTTHPGNIGAAARAMKTMGLSRLVLVNPKHFPDPQATAMASGADDVLDRATVCDSLDQALQGTRFAIAMTARRRDISHLAVDVRDAAVEMIREAAQDEVALVFGTEMSGLSNEDVLKCQRMAHIDANPEYSSLNLAAAVQVMTYELRQAAMGGFKKEVERFDAAAFDDIEAFYAHLEERLITSGFLDPQQPKRLMERLRRLFGRARLEKEEVNILRGILTAWERPKRRD